MKPNMHILLVDDEPTGYIESLQLRLSKILGHQVTLATTADEALAKLNRDIDLMLVDYKMPGKTGMDFGKIVDQTPAFAHIPIVMLTAYKNDESMLRAMGECEYDYFLGKEDFQGTDIEETLSFLETVPKFIKKRRRKDPDEQVDHLRSDYNDEFLRQFFENFEKATNDHCKPETVQLIMDRLRHQEEILAMAKAEGGISIGRENLSGGMFLLENKRPLNAAILKTLSKKSGYTTHGIPENCYNSLMMQLGFKKGDIITSNGAFIMGYLYHHSSEFPLTRLAAGRRKDKVKFYTLIDKIFKALPDYVLRLAPQKKV